MEITPSKIYHPATADLFADSFDDWIEPKRQAPNDELESVNVSKWAAWPSVDTPDSWSEQNEETAERATPTSSSSERWRRFMGWAALGSGVLLLFVPLLSSLFATVFPRPTTPAPALTGSLKVSAQKRMLWQKAIVQNAFEMARWQAKRQNRNLNAGQRLNVAQKAVLLTVNTNGPDYENFAHAKTTGIVDGTLWNLALTHALRGGILPPRQTVRHTRVSMPRTVRRVRVARSIRRRTPQKHAIILGRGPIREDSASIILIRD
jgi:hypothetical protein